MNSKRCIKCKVEKLESFDNFYKHKMNGPNIIFKGTCKECFKSKKKEKGYDPIKNKEYCSRYYKRNSDHLINMTLKSYIKKKHGIELC